MKWIRWVLIVLFLTVGCSSVPLKITNVPTRQYEILGEATGKATGIMLFQLIPINQNERFERAYQRAVQSLGGDFLIDPVISERWFWGYILNGYTTTVTGKVAKWK